MRQIGTAHGVGDQDTLLRLRRSSLASLRQLEWLKESYGGALQSDALLCGARFLPLRPS